MQNQVSSERLGVVSIESRSEINRSVECVGSAIIVGVSMKRTGHIRDSNIPRYLTFSSDRNFPRLPDLHHSTFDFGDVCSILKITALRFLEKLSSHYLCHFQYELIPIVCAFKAYTFTCFTCAVGFIHTSDFSSTTTAVRGQCLLIRRW